MGSSWRSCPSSFTAWEAGRFAARRALSGWLVGPSAPEDLEIGAAPDGAPEALTKGAKLPETLSISHRAGHALCAVAGPILALGADIERIEPRSDAFLNQFFTDAEQKTVAQSPSEEHDLLANLIWSAKECAAKGLRLGLQIDTRRLLVELVEAPANA